MACSVRVRRRTAERTGALWLRPCAALPTMRCSSIDRKFLRGESDELQWNLDVERKERLRKYPVVLSYCRTVALAVPHAPVGVRVPYPCSVLEYLDHTGASSPGYARMRASEVTGSAYAVRCMPCHARRVVCAVARVVGPRGRHAADARKDGQRAAAAEPASPGTVGIALAPLRRSRPVQYCRSAPSTHSLMPYQPLVR